jgi:protein TonB
MSMVIHTCIAAALLFAGAARSQLDLSLVPVVHAAGPEMVVMDVTPSLNEDITRPLETKPPAADKPSARVVTPFSGLPATNEVLQPAATPMPVAVRTVPADDLYPTEAPPPTVAPLEVVNSSAMPGLDGTGVQIYFAELLLRTLPDYPKEARMKGVQGTVLLSGTVSLAGRIIDLKIISGNPLLTDAAIDCVRQWRYRPASIGGTVVDSPIRVYVNFVLRTVAATASGGRPRR